MKIYFKVFIVKYLEKTCTVFFLNGNRVKQRFLTLVLK